MKIISSFKVIIVGLALCQNQAFANPAAIDHCIDSQSRFLLQKFIPSGHGDLGSMKFIDLFNRQTFDLFCGFERDEAVQIEIACVSSHLGEDGSGKTIRVRVHRQTLTSIPRLALLEIQLKDQPVGSINDMIPMICE